VVRDLRIIDFTDEMPLFSRLADVDRDNAEVIALLKAIGREMARPIDPNATETEYVPTQYVAEVIRAAGYDGLAYQSAVGAGTNFVLFDRDDALVTYVRLYEVDAVDYQYHAPAGDAFDESERSSAAEAPRQQLGLRVSRSGS
jgi:hypothetical protein